MTRPNIFPVLRCRDGAAAIQWLSEAFGFATRFQVAGPDGGLAHAQMQLGAGIVMVGPGGVADPWREAAMGTYVCVPDVDAHHARSCQAGAAIVMALHDMDYGSREYTARDPEGHLWSFGTYDPYDGPHDALPDGGKPDIFPAFGYRDAPAALAWLERAFGFTPLKVDEQPGGAIAHAELGLGAGLIMMGSNDESDPDNPWRSAAMGLYARIPDPAHHFAQAEAAGAQILRPLRQTDYGSHEYTARDPEGHLWSFGTYDPWSAG